MRMHRFLGRSGNVQCDLHGNNLAEKCAEANSKTNGGTSLLETGDDFFQPRGFGLERFTEHFSGKINHQDAKARRKNLRLNELASDIVKCKRRVKSKSKL